MYIFPMYKFSLVPIYQTYNVIIIIARGHKSIHTTKNIHILSPIHILFCVDVLAKMTLNRDARISFLVVLVNKQKRKTFTPSCHRPHSVRARCDGHIYVRPNYGHAAPCNDAHVHYCGIARFCTLAFLKEGLVVRSFEGQCAVAPSS